MAGILLAAKNDIVRQMAVQDRETTVAEDIGLGRKRTARIEIARLCAGPLVVDPKCGVNSEHSILTLQRWMKEAVDV